MTSYLDSIKRLISPLSVAIVGASRKGNRGTEVLRNLRKVGFQGDTYAINPNYQSVEGVPCFPDVRSLPRVVDCLIVSVNADAACDALEQAFCAGIRAAVVLAAGFGEGGKGEERARRLDALIQGGMAICGPNCYGIVNTAAQVASYSGPLITPMPLGTLALVSQSGGLANTILCSLAADRQIGFRYVIGCGNQRGVRLEDYIDYLLDDEHVHVVGVVAESLVKPRKLLAASRKARQLNKLIVIYKIGQSDVGRAMVQSHTGALANDRTIASAFFRRCGVIEANDFDHFVETLALLEALHASKETSDNILLLVGSGGGAAIFADVLASCAPDVRFGEFSAKTEQAIRNCLPDFGSVSNPLDGTGAMFEDPTILPRLLDALLSDEEKPRLLATVSARSDNFSNVMAFVARCFADAVKRQQRDIIAVQGSPHGPLDREIVAVLRGAGIPLLLGYRAAMLALNSMILHKRRSGQATEIDSGETMSQRRPPLSECGQSSGFVELSFTLREAGIPVADALRVADEDAAVDAFNRLKAPVVVKVDEPDLLHKSDVGCVVLGCRTPAEVKTAYRKVVRAASAVGFTAPAVIVQPLVEGLSEVIVGISYDPLFGSAISVGMGGLFVEIMRDSVTEMAPVSEAEAHSMISRLNGARMLRGVRGRAAGDVSALAVLIANLSRFAVANEGSFKTLELNPVILLPEGAGVIAVDIALEPLSSIDQASDRTLAVEIAR